MHPRCSPRSDELRIAPCEKSFHAVMYSPMRYFLTRNKEISRKESDVAKSGLSTR